MNFVFLELPKPPIIQSVILDPDDVRGVLVFWTPEYDGNTPILKYSIQYHEVIYGEGESCVSLDGRMTDFNAIMCSLYAPKGRNAKCSSNCLVLQMSCILVMDNGRG